VTCLKEANNSAQSLLQLIVQEFPCFRDEANYQGQRGEIPSHYLINNAPGTCA